jgi:hypothetical protein
MDRGRAVLPRKEHHGIQFVCCRALVKLQKKTCSNAKKLAKTTSIHFLSVSESGCLKDDWIGRDILVDMENHSEYNHQVLYQIQWKAKHVMPSQ